MADPGGVHPNSDSKTPVPDWVDSTVADWIKSEVSKMEDAWGPSSSRQAVAFVHIPPLVNELSLFLMSKSRLNALIRHAIQAVQSTINPIKNPGQNGLSILLKTGMDHWGNTSLADTLGTGSVQDSQHGDGGNDAPFWDSVNTNVKNLRVIISGHGTNLVRIKRTFWLDFFFLYLDHGNEWCARELKKNVIFCFDKHSGYGGYDSPGWGHGVRNLVFSTDPAAGIDTWIRFETGMTRARVTLDANYDKQ